MQLTKTNLFHLQLIEAWENRKESIYLELGLVPISVIIKLRRVMYLHYLANLKKGEMLYEVFKTQCQYPRKDDWTETMRADLTELGLNPNLEHLRSISKNSFKRLFKHKSKQFALEYLSINRQAAK